MMPESNRRAQEIMAKTKKNLSFRPYVSATARKFKIETGTSNEHNDHIAIKSKAILRIEHSCQCRLESVVSVLILIL